MEIEPEEQSVANALLLSQFVAIFGALLPVFFEKRFISQTKFIRCSTVPSMASEMLLKTK